MKSFVQSFYKKIRLNVLKIPNFKESVQLTPHMTLIYNSKLSSVFRQVRSTWCWWWPKLLRSRLPHRRLHNMTIQDHTFHLHILHRTQDTPIFFYTERLYWKPSDINLPNQLSTVSHRIVFFGVFLKVYTGNVFPRNCILRLRLKDKLSQNFFCWYFLCIV